MKMAATSVPVKYLDDITECPICTEVYTDPRMLPCIHTFCLKCISTWGKDKEPGDSLACPLCRKEVKVPVEGLQELQRNIFVDKLLEAKRLSCLRSTGDELCEVCDKKAELAMHCVDCQQSMCQDCAASHKRIRLTKSHKLLELGPQSESVQCLLRISESFCEKHEEKKLELYCFYCKLVICMMCFVHSHKSHECRDVKEVADELSGKLKADIGGMSEKVVQCQNMIKQLITVGNENTQTVSKMEYEISARADALKIQIDHIKDSMIEELRSDKKIQDKKLETLKEELEGQIMMMESLRKYSLELMEKGTSSDIARAASDLQDRSKELMQFNVDELASAEDFKSQFAFNCNGWDSAIELRDVFGHLNSANSSKKSTSGEFPHSVKPVHVIPKAGSGVEGVTSLGAEVFVVRSVKSKGEVLVYNVNTMSLKRSVHLPGLGFTYCGLVACEFNNCLYVSDINASKINKVELTTGNNIVITWPVAKSPEGLSLNSSHNVIVASNNEKKFQEYTTRGILVREISVQSGIENLVHVVQLSADEFGVTYQKPKSGFYIVGVDSRVSRSYRNSGAGQLKSPRCIAVNKRGFIFIADENNNRIVVLHPQTLSSRVLPLDCGLCCPMGLWLDKSRDCLYIGEHGGEGRVIVINGINNISFQ